MRTLAAVERDIAYHAAIAAADTLGDALDNDGRVAHTADERRAISRRALERLERERRDFHRILGIDGGAQ